MTGDAPKTRRIRKTTPTTETTFVYDGWNLIHETVSAVNGSTTNTTEIQYFWGMDLSETLQGAGGVGGLLAVSSNGSFYFPAYDNNGNVAKYINESGNIVASYEYDDFGRLISKSGPMADFFRIRFSTKYYDFETSLYYYGYRFYSPALMRWLNRDPIGERGGLNLYLAVANSPVLFIDALGFYRLIYHKFGTPPQGGWKREIDAAFKATFRFPQVFMLGYPQGKIGYRVDFHPQESVFEIFLRESFTFDAINDELDHVNCAIIYDTALGVFKDEVEKIIACPNVAQQKYDAAKSKLQAAEKKCKQCNDALDAKDGPHGH